MSEPSRQPAPQPSQVPRPAPPANNHDQRPAHPLADLHHAVGNLGVLNQLAGPGIQPKLEVGAPDDEHEREADDVAAAVMRKPQDTAIDALGADDRPTIRRAPEEKKKASPAAGGGAAASKAGAAGPAAGAALGAKAAGGTAARGAAAPAHAAPATAKKKSPGGAAPKGAPAGHAAAKPKPPEKQAPKAPVAGKAATKHPDAKTQHAAHEKAKELAKKKPALGAAHAPGAPAGHKPSEKPEAKASRPAAPSPHRAGGPPKFVTEPPSQTLTQPQSPSTPAEHKPEERKSDELAVRTKPASPGAVPAVTSSAARTIQSAQGGGQPLSPGDRSFYESRLGRDLSGVRLHDNASAHQAAKDVKAKAFTYGQDVFFAAGRHQPGTSAGRELMAHELAHTIQQRPGAKLDRKVQRQGDGQPAPAAATPGPGGVVRDEQSKKLTFPTLDVPGFRKADPSGKYNGPLTRPKGYDRSKAAPTPQSQVWTEKTKDGVAGKVPAMLEKVKATLHEGKYFIASSGSGSADRFFVGATAAELAPDLTRPEWDSAAKSHGYRGFQVDHILELQLGGSNDVENMELLDRTINARSGSYIKNSIEKSVNDYLKAVPDGERKDPKLKLDEWRENWDLTFTATQAGTGGGPGTLADTDHWPASRIQSGDHLMVEGALKEADPTKLGSKSELKLLPSGGGGLVTTLHPKDSPGSVRFFKPFKATAATYFVDDGQENSETLATFTFELDSKGLTSPGEHAVSVPRVKGARYVGQIDRAAARSELRNLGASKFSAITIEEAELGPNGIYAEGEIIADLPIIKGAPIELVLDGPKLTISHEFAAGEFKLPPPLKVAGASLRVSASTDGDIEAQGRVDLEIEKLGKGYLQAGGGTTSGLSLDGGFDFTSEIFKRAHVGFHYHEGKYSGDGELVLGSGKVKGVKGGSLKASYADDHFEASGHADFDIPGVESADVGLSYDAQNGMTITASPKLKELPGIKSGSLSVTINEPAGGGPIKVSGHGDAEPDIPGIDAHLTVAYDDGAFLAKVSVPFKVSKLDGTIEAGATNMQVDDDGKPVPGGAVGDVRIFGAGSATLHITDWLTGTAKIRLLANGEVEVHGDLTVDNVHLYEGKDLVDQDIVPMIHTDVPIFPPVVLGLGAGLKLKVGYGPGVLSGSIGVTYNPSHPDKTALHGGLGFHADAHAGLELYTTVGLGLGITGASVTANIVLGGELRLEAPLDDTVTIDWTPDTGVKLVQTLTVSVEPKLRITLGANLVGTLGPYSHVFWHEDLAGVEYGSGLKLGLTWPITYEEGKPFNPSIDDIKVDKPSFDPAATAKQILQEHAKT